MTQDGLPTILNINPVATSVQQTVGQLIQQGSSLPGDVLQQGCVLPSGVSLFKDQLRSVINVARELEILSHFSSWLIVFFTENLERLWLETFNVQKQFFIANISNYS